MSPNRLLFYLLTGSCAAYALFPEFAGNNEQLGYEISIAPDDSVKKSKSELQYPVKDREGDFMTDKDDNPFLLDDPSQIKKDVEYDPETDRYILTETMDGRNVKPPTYLTFDEYRDYERRQAQQDYWQERAKSISLIEQKGVVPPLYVTKKRFGDIFGGNTIDIKPSGNIDLTFGGNVQKIDNPTLPERQRRNGGFDFDMNINMSVVGKIGDKVKINMTYNTQATFDFENQIKLNYEGEEDDIIKLIEAGNINFPLPTTLITGSQSLFGLKTRLQFGRLTVTNVYSQQKSRMESVTIDRGGQISPFEVFADQYDENRHFFLAQYFRDNFNDALFTLPNVRSLVNITRLDVWVTNRTGATENARDIMAFMDLGESNRVHNTSAIGPASPRCVYENNCPNSPYPSNCSNDLYENITGRANSRSIDNVVTVAQSLGLVAVQDFEKTYARKLNPTEYTFHPQLGYLSLNQALFADEVIGVAFEYTFDGCTYRVGEFAQDVTNGIDSTSIIDTSSNVVARSQVVYLKMLKGTSPRPRLPIWDLMMKNIYSIGAFQVNKEDFTLDIYFQDPGGGVKRYIPEGQISNAQLIRVLNLDRLNTNGDPMPDGIFDFVPGITITPNNGRIIFPVLEPFGNDLRAKMEAEGDGGLADKYVYDQLYDSTKIIAQQFPQYNRFVIRGTYKSSVSNEISLGAFNVPPGSVRVTAGGQQLVENQDYTIDYSLGRVRIINEGVLNSGVPINVSYENNALFGFQTKTMFGTRLDYKVSDKFSWGGTLLHLRERPFTPKVNIGDDPIKNMQLGLDANYNTESQFLTWLVDKLPLYQTKETSTFSLSGEMAHLKPGHQRAIGKEGTVYVDDFEGTTNSYQLNFPVPSWALASTPQNARDRNGNILFREADLSNDLTYGYNRARICWYNIDPLFNQTSSATPGHIANTPQQNNAYTRSIPQQEVFPNRSNLYNFNTNLQTFDIAYYPDQRGPYNFDSRQGLILPNGRFSNPENRWGGIMRSIDNTNFEATNTEFIEFWIQDPFIYNPTSEGGQLYINLGNISEDILKDGRKFFENGLQAPGSTVPVDSTAWGVVPRNQPITNAFDNDLEKRQYQDLGFDGLNDEQEAIKFSTFLNDISAIVTDPEALSLLREDPSSDNYHYYQGEDYDNQREPILGRYKKYNNPHGNSPVSGTGQTVSQAFTNIPDFEDLNRDFTVNETEEYFQYRLDIRPDMQVGENFITDKIIKENVTLDIGPTDVTWYQFKIPINEYERKVGDIPDFKSIRFMRIFLSGFEDSVVLRFARMELVRNQWRRYQFSLLEPGEYIPDDEFGSTFFSVAAVNVEDNSERVPIPYALPPGIEREQNLSTTNATALQNEQALQVQVCDLKDGDARAVFKTLNLDLRMYSRLKMFIHAESRDPSNLVQDGELRAFIRLGSDFTNNYYEYELPLAMTPYGNYDPTTDASREAIWPEINNLDIPLDSFYLVKLVRNAANNPDVTSPFVVTDQKGNRFTIVGNPDLGLVRAVMLGIRNPKALGETGDDGRPKCAEVWFNEMRLSGLDERGAYAATARMEARLADLGTVTFSTLMHTRGYGQIEQRVQERFRDDFWQYDFASNVELSKFLPEKIGLRIPFYGGITQKFSTPEFDPYELDVPLKNKLNIAEDRRDYKRQVQARETIKSFNFTNVRFVPGRSDKKIRFYHPSNFNFTYAFTNTLRTTAFIESDRIKKYKGAFGYNFSPEAKPISPLSKAIKNKSKYLDFIRDINFNFIPNNLSFSTEMNRQFAEMQLRRIGNEEVTPPTYNKWFTWDRIYGIKYNPFKSVTLDFTAINNAFIDEPEGRIKGPNTEIRPGYSKRDSLWTNIFNGGRTTRYQHNFSANYNVPLNKFPVVDWMQARAGYTSSYSWTTGALFREVDTVNSVLVLGDNIVQNPLGNIIGNTSDLKLNAELDFRKLYEKFRRLRPYNATRARTDNDWKKSERAKKLADAKKKRDKIDKDIETAMKDIERINANIKELKKDTIPNKKEEIKKLKKERKEKKQKIKKLKTDKNKIQNPESPAVSPFVRPFIAIKRVSFNYGISRGTTLPGYMPRTQLLGLSKGFSSPGWGFVFGEQPGANFFASSEPAQRNAWLNDKAAKGWISRDVFLNYQFMQFVNKNLDIKATLEPFRDFKVDLTMNRVITESFSEYFKVRAIEPDRGFQHLTPMTTGSYTISTIAVKTMFNKPDARGFSQEFRKFQDEYRSAISFRLAGMNKGLDSLGNPITGLDSIFYLPPDSNDNSLADEMYRKGYGRYNRDVLIPAFIAAYLGKDINSVSLDPFKPHRRNIPLPNWRITYNGLSNLPMFKKAVRTINITHGYNATYTVSGYISDLTFNTDLPDEATVADKYYRPTRVDTLSNNLVSFYSIPQIVITEQFSPLIGIDINFNNGITTKFDFKKTRNVSLGLNDFLVSESKTSEVTVGFGYRLKGLKLPFKFKGKKKSLPNEINFRFDFSYRDNVTVNQRLDQEISEPTRGMKTIRVAPSIDYVINNRLNIRIFFDRNRTIPATSASFPITNTRAGVTLRFSLTQ